MKGISYLALLDVSSASLTLPGLGVTLSYRDFAAPTDGNIGSNEAVYQATPPSLLPHLSGVQMNSEEYLAATCWWSLILSVFSRAPLEIPTWHVAPISCFSRERCVSHSAEVADLHSISQL